MSRGMQINRSPEWPDVRGWLRLGLGLPLALTLTSSLFGCSADTAEAPETGAPQAQTGSQSTDGTDGTMGGNGTGGSSGTSASDGTELAMEACPNLRFVGQVDSDDDCPAPAGNFPWSTRRLFDGNGSPDPDLPETLAPFCLYEWTGNPSGPGPQALGALPGYGTAGPNEWLDRDCMVVATQNGAGKAAAVHALAFPEHDAAFRTQAEEPASLPTAVGDVRVAVVDSWPRENPEPGVEPGQSRHGLAMGRIVEQLVCDPMGAGPATCPVFVRRHLALNLEAPGVTNNAEGGFFGFQGRLAEVIYGAVKTWQAEDPGAHLVINLSLGWAPQYNDGSPLDGPGTSAAVVAVRRAIEHARCSGAIIVAAAGNAETGPAPGSGPLMPAAWSTQAAPTGCGTGPLLFAASGVDGEDEPLRNARPGANARFAAPAFGVMTELTDMTGNQIITSPLTGSSVAAAVTSAAAAAAWAYAPGKTADEVMDMVWAAGEDLARTADFCLAPPCANTHRVSICRTAQLAGATVSCTPIAAGAGTRLTWSETLVAAIENEGFFEADGTNMTALITPPGCDDEVAIEAGQSTYPGPWGCPESQLPNNTSAPWVNPQPPPDPCPACYAILAAEVEQVVYIIIDDHYRTIAYPEQMALYNRAGTVLYQWNLSRVTDTSGHRLGSGLDPGDVYVVELPNSGYVGADVHAVTIEWVDSGSSSRTTAVSELLFR